MRAEVEAEYKAALRAHVLENGRPVKFDGRTDYLTDRPSVSIYGWGDWEKLKHVLGSAYTGNKKDKPCSWVLPDPAELTEETYTQFAGSFAENEPEVGINVSGVSCACGQITDTTLRAEGTLTEILHSILDLPTKPVYRI